MAPFSIHIGPNIRKSPFFDATVEDGVRSFSVYNHMFIPGHFGDPEAEYDRLINGVAMWDVGAERQVEISGPDAAKLVAYLTPRDLSGTKIGQGRYIPICDYEGWLINDPVLLKLAEDRFWLSIADSDIALWAQAIGRERGLNVRIAEADAAPLAIQGPKAEDVTAALLGEWVRDLKYFWFKETELDGIPLLVCRSGWSKQGGFELFLQDAQYGSELWRRVKQAGKPFGIGPGAPNDVERIENGLLSYGADCRRQSYPANPFEVGLGKLVDLNRQDDFVGKDALQRIKAAGVTRKLVKVEIDGPPVSGNQNPLPLINGEGALVGHLMEMIYSKRSGKNLGVAMIEIAAVEAQFFLQEGPNSRAVKATANG